MPIYFDSNRKGGVHTGVHTCGASAAWLHSLAHSRTMSRACTLLRDWAPVHHTSTAIFLSTACHQHTACHMRHNTFGFLFYFLPKL